MVYFGFEERYSLAVQHTNSAFQHPADYISFFLRVLFEFAVGDVTVVVHIEGRDWCVYGRVLLG